MRCAVLFRAHFPNLFVDRKQTNQYGVRFLFVSNLNFRALFVFR